MPSRRQDVQPTKPTRRPVNPWKWATIVLLALLLGTGGYFAIQGFRSPESTTEQTADTSTNGTSIPIQMNRDQLNGLMSYYLNDFQKGQQLKYRFEVRQKAAYLIGTTEVFGQSVSFVITLQPSVLSNGNIRLEATKLSVGALSVPISFVMNYIANNYKVPKWIALHPSQKTIDLKLNQVAGKNEVWYSASKLDLQQNQFNFVMHVPATSNN